jgi:broad-specificity NMP kinase
MIILVCGPEGSGKTTIAKPLAELLCAEYVTKDTYKQELKGYIDGIASTGKIVVVDKRCNTNAAVEYLNPDDVVWMDMRTVKTEKPYKVNYHIEKWFTDSHNQLLEVVKRYMEIKNA